MLDGLHPFATKLPSARSEVGQIKVQRVKQILQSLRTGRTEIADVPAPRAARGTLLVRTTCTIVSAGTERMLVEFGRASLLEKARQQPDRVQQVFDRIRTDGLLPTLQSVRNKLDKPLPLGYCNVGIVAAIGEGVTGFAVGDRVASNGNHAEVVAVGANLCAKIPGGVSDDDAAFTVLGAIALQGIRLAAPTLGESVMVMGLGLIGQMTVQLLRAHGCRVIGADYDPHRLALARRHGAATVDLGANPDPVQAATSYSRGRGVDAVIITASTKSSEPMHQAALMSRQRGRIVLVGVTGLELARDDFYKKELTFQVSSSYGPGRYDAGYEEKGLDYPIGFVRWTEQRNFEAVLDMMADRRIDAAALISHRFAISHAQDAYALVSSSEPSLGIMLDYPTTSFAAPVTTVVLQPEGSGSTARVPGREPTVSFIGAGNYASAVLIPAFRAAGARLRTVASSGGVSGVHAGRRFGFDQTTTDTASLFADAATDAVVISTRHNSHARLVVEALEHGKHVFVEKPLCLTTDEAERIDVAYTHAQACGNAPILMVGFNRRFAPQVLQIRRLLEGHPGPKSFVMTVNAGVIPPDHWTQDPEVGGGRIIGEACHFVDLLRHLCGHVIEGAETMRMQSHSGDTVTLQLRFADGSIGTVHYFANGSKQFPKERLDVFAGGRVLQLDNFRRLRGYGFRGFSSMNLWRQDKGQAACAAAFVSAIANGKPSPIPLAEVLEVARVTIALANG